MEIHPLFGEHGETESTGSPRRKVSLLQKGSRRRDRSSCNGGRDMARARRSWRALHAAILIAAGASSLVINGYYNTSTAHQRTTGGYSSRSPSSSMLHLIEAYLSSFQAQQREQQDRRLPIFIRDPRPEQLLAACLIYGVAMNGYFHLHKGDRYQYWFAASGVVSAFAVGWASGKDVHGILMDFMPWLLILSLLLSAAFHNVLARTDAILSS